VSDIDIYSCGSAGVAGCFEGGGAALRGLTARPRKCSPSSQPLGVHYFVVEKYSGGENPNVILTITKKN